MTFEFSTLSLKTRVRRIESCIAAIIIVVIVINSTKKDYIAINWIFVLFIMVQTGQHLKDLLLEATATVGIVSYNI